MKRKPLQVTLDVREPSVIELTVGEKVQLDRLEPSHESHESHEASHQVPRPRYVAKRHGELLDRGVATLALDAGVYHFKTLSDTHLKVIRGGVTMGLRTSNKNNEPTVPPISPSEPPAPAAKGDAGDEASGEAPVLTVE